MAADALKLVDELRLEANGKLHAETKAALGQFMTPLSIATLMASILRNPKSEVSILDAGAGAGSLFTAAVFELMDRSPKPNRIRVHAYEVDSTFLPFIERAVEMCQGHGRECDVEVVVDVTIADFVCDLAHELFLKPPAEKFDYAILNPPYGKIRSSSETRKALRKLDVEASNLYSGFIALAIQLLKDSGQLVAITPRSFCNGAYFYPFRQLLLRHMSIDRFHVYEARNIAFRDDDVLQENIILGATKGAQADEVLISSSQGPLSSEIQSSVVPFNTVVRRDDKDLFIHLPRGEDDWILEWAGSLPCTLTDIGLQVSTGRVVDFRVLELIAQNWEPGYVPLIYPTHFRSGKIAWPKNGKKPNAIRYEEDRDLFVPNGNYVLVRRFSAKEENRRLVACMLEAKDFGFAHLGFENHLNYFHEGGIGLDYRLALGLTTFLNCSQLDTYFRIFSGHTQVNATDLRKLRYPSRAQLIDLGEAAQNEDLSPHKIDSLVMTAVTNRQLAAVSI